MSRVKRDNAQIEYRVHGKGETTLLFVPGSYMEQGYWRDQVEHLQSEYRIITMDLPGQGASGRERVNWSVRGFAEDVAAVIGEADSEDIILIGHSLGADIALMAATSHPESITGFVAIDMFKNAATPLPEENQKQVETILANLQTDFAGTNEQYARMALLTPQTPPAVSERVVKAYREAYRPMGLATTPEIFDIYKVEKELLPQLRTKLHLINVDYMPTNEEPLKAYARNGYDLVRLPGTSHYPMLENPRALNEALDQVLRKIAAENVIIV